jgi:PhnB protein
MAAKPIPEGYHTLTPYLAVDDATRAIDFYKQAFGATERFRMPAPGGKVGHAELQVGDSFVMLSDPFPQSSTKPPKELGATSMTLFMYVDDVDATVQRAEEAGATVAAQPEDMFWGDRSGRVNDPFGHQWMIATHVEDVPPEEVAERAKQAMAGTS